jgi:hypothetical protein
LKRRRRLRAMRRKQNEHHAGSETVLQRELASTRKLFQLNAAASNLVCVRESSASVRHADRAVFGRPEWPGASGVPVDAGGLAQAYALEVLASLWVVLGYGAGRWAVASLSG